MTIAKAVSISKCLVALLRISSALATMASPRVNSLGSLAIIAAKTVPGSVKMFRHSGTSCSSARWISAGTPTMSTFVDS